MERETFRYESLVDEELDLKLVVKILTRQNLSTMGFSDDEVSASMATNLHVISINT
jgi:hypothetical protein